MCARRYTPASRQRSSGRLTSRSVNRTWRTIRIGFLFSKPESRQKNRRFEILRSGDPTPENFLIVAKHGDSYFTKPSQSSSLFGSNSIQGIARQRRVLPYLDGLCQS